jgi:hypothetical protein
MGEDGRLVQGLIVLVNLIYRLKRQAPERRIERGGSDDARKEPHDETDQFMDALREY